MYSFKLLNYVAQYKSMYLIKAFVKKEKKLTFLMERLVAQMTSVGLMSSMGLTMWY